MPRIWPGGTRSTLNGCGSATPSTNTCTPTHPFHCVCAVSPGESRSRNVIRPRFTTMIPAVSSARLGYDLGGGESALPHPEPPLLRASGLVSSPCQNGTPAGPRFGAPGQSNAVHRCRENRRAGPTHFAGTLWDRVRRSPGTAILSTQHRPATRAARLIKSVPVGESFSQAVLLAFDFAARACAPTVAQTLDVV